MNSITLTIREGSDTITVMGVDPGDVNHYVEQLLAMEPRPGLELELVDEPPFEEGHALIRSATPLPEFPLPVPAADIAAELSRIADYVDVFAEADAFREGLADA